MATIVQDTQRLKDALTISKTDGRVSEVETVADSWAMFTGSLSNLRSSLSDGVPIGSLVGAAAGALESSIRNNLGEVLSYLTQTKKVKVKSLLDAAGGAFARTPEETWTLINSRLDTWISQLEKSGLSILRQIGSDIINDPKLKATLNSLEDVQALAATISSAVGLYESIRSLADRFEPYFPILEILVDAAMVFWSGGATVPKVTSASAQAAMQELKKLVPLILQPIKKYIYNVELDVPVILLGGLNLLTDSTATSNWNKFSISAENTLQISDQQYIDAKAGLTWQESYDRYIPKTLPFTSKALRTWALETGEGQSLLIRLSLGDKLYSAPIYSSNESNSGSMGLMNFSEQDLMRISKELIEADTSRDIFYVDRSLQSLVVQELAADGAIIDTATRSYDEEETLRNPQGDRGAFKRINDRINSYHELLRVITGEVRPSITETIPVVDFYYKKNTSLLNKYTEGSIREGSYSIIDPVIDVPANSPESPDSNSLLLSNNESILNLAVSQYDIAKCFYNTSAPLSQENNIQVSAASDNKLKASGLLSGYFTYPAEFSLEDPAKVETWAWGVGYDGIDYQQKARAFGISIPKGIAYNDSHLLNRGSIVERPLITTTPGFEGLASELYHDFSEAIQDQILAPYTVRDLPTWESLGGELQMVSSFDHTVPATRTVNYTVTTWEWLGWFKGHFVKKTRSRQETYIPAKYPDKLKFICEEPGNFVPSYWQSKVEGGWLVLNADNDTSISIEQTRLANPYDPLEHYYGETVVSGEDFLISGGKYFQASIHNNSITQVSYITPLDLFFNSKNKVSEENSPRTALLIPDQFNSELTSMRGTSIQDYYFPDTMYLASKDDLGFTTSGPTSLCTFTDGNNMLIMKVSAIHSTKNLPSKVKVIKNGNLYTNNSTRLRKYGEDCYIYTLIAIKIDYKLDEIDFYPIKYPSQFFSLETNSVDGQFYNKILNLQDSSSKMVSMAIIAGLPPVELGKSFKDYSISKVSGAPLSSADIILDNTSPTINSLIYQAIKNLPLIELEIGGENRNFPLGRMAEILKPIIQSEDLFSVMASQGNTSVRGLLNKMHHYKEMYQLLSKCFIPGAAGLTLDNCRTLDALLGNSSEPWLVISDEGDISESQLETLAADLKGYLEGSPDNGNYSVRFLEGDSSVTGRKGSLYYQRYMFLNNRLNKTEGHLAKAAQLLENWNRVRKSLEQKASKVDAYESYINAESVLSSEGLYYAPKSDLFDSAFYSTGLMTHLKDRIGNNCLLICGECPLKTSCSLYNEDDVLRAYVPQQDSIELWFKDNELDLLAYEGTSSEPSLEMKTSEGKFLSARESQKSHYPYTEILHNDREIKLFDTRNEISTRVANYYNPSTREYHDPLNWLQGGRYGSLILNKKNGLVSNDPKDHKYLYDAVFLHDEESAFVYNPSITRYPVSLNSGGELYEGSVRIKIPRNLKILAEANPESDVYLVSDDLKDSAGNPLEPIVYVNKVKNLQVAFDLRENPADEELMTSADLTGFKAKDIAQFCINQYKKLDDKKDKWWMNTVIKTVGNTIISGSGRPRIISTVDPLTSNPTQEEVLSGKPLVNTYIDFIRKMNIKFDCFLWDKNGNESTVEKKKATLPCMVTGLRLVVVDP